MSNIIFYLAFGIMSASFFLTFVFLFRATMFCGNKKYSSADIQTKNYSKVSFLNTLARM